MNDKLLPFVSVVMLQEGNKRLMIFGRKQKSLSDNRDKIDKIYFIGYQDREEFELHICR